MVEQASDDAFRRVLDDFQRQWSEEDRRDRISNRVTIRLAELYRTADDIGRSVFDQVLVEWLRSRDAGRRFDAQALIGEFRICSALPAVRETLACWQAALEKYSDMTRDGDYGLARSQALSAVHALELLVRDLEAACQ